VSTFNHQACPLCHDDASYRFAGDDKLFVCSACTVYRITANAEKFIAERIRPGTAVNYTTQALNAPPGETLTIDLDEQTHQLVACYRSNAATNLGVS
jgi:hypothetical protein